MRAVAIFIFIGVAATRVSISRLFLASFFLAERVDGAIGLLLATGIFTIAMAAVVRK